MTIQEAILKTLQETNLVMSSNEILEHIVKENYYNFGANKPIAAIRPELKKLIDNDKVTRIKEDNIFMYKIEK